MFDSLKKRLKGSVKRIAKTVKGEEEKPAVKKPVKHEKKMVEKAEKPAKLGFRERIKKRITERRLTEGDIDGFFQEMELDMLRANVALEVVDFLKSSLKEKLADRIIKRKEAERFIKNAFREALTEIVNQGEVDVLKTIKKNKPACFVFLGFNGSGKTSSIAKMARYLMAKGLKPVLAAGDTFRAASIEQLEHHGNRLKIKTIKHTYGADSAAVVFDAVKFSQAKGYDVVLADTAGRSHADVNLMDELKKVCRVNNPHLKILVVDSLTGNDAVEQAKHFHEAVGVDGVVLTKIDVNKKGGSVLSVCWAIKKPILFFGTGQEYKDLEPFEVKDFVNDLLG